MSSLKDRLQSFHLSLTHISSENKFETSDMFIIEVFSIQRRGSHFRASCHYNDKQCMFHTIVELSQTFWSINFLLREAFLQKLLLKKMKLFFPEDCFEVNIKDKLLEKEKKIFNTCWKFIKNNEVLL